MTFDLKRPVGRSGGYAGQLYKQLQIPDWAAPSDWQSLGAADSTPDDGAMAVTRIVQAYIHDSGKE